MKQLYVQRTKNKELIPVEVTIQYEKYEAQEFLIAFARDITKRKQSELDLKQTLHELTKSEKRMDIILNSAQLGFWEFHLNNGELYSTDATEILLGYSPGQIMEKTSDNWNTLKPTKSFVRKFIHPEDRQIFLSDLNNLMLHKTDFFRHQIRFKSCTGSWKWVQNVGKIMEWDDAQKPLIAYGVLLDVDEMKQLQLELTKSKEIAESANAAKSIFLAHMSHEIRTPLNAILGYSHLMAQDQQLSVLQKDRLQIMGESGKHLLMLLNDVLEMSKIESGKIDIEKETFNLTSMLNNLHKMFNSRAMEKGVTFTSEFSVTASDYIIQDKAKLQQILTNLINNAIKFTDHGTITLRYRLSKIRDKAIFKHSGGDFRELYLSLEVEDTGCGIHRSEIEKIFEAFEQTKAGRKVAGGTGLGLAISRQYARLMGGDLVLVNSEVERGSLFRVSLPVRRGRKNKQEQLVERLAIKSIKQVDITYKILIVDDRYTNRDILEQMLTGVGFQVATARNGKEALEKFKEVSPHCILMDIKMPVMDGIEATRRIRRLQGGQQTVILIISGNVMVDQQSTALNFGADDFIIKPVQSEKLFSKLSKHLGIEYLYHPMSPKNEEVFEPTISAMKDVHCLSLVLREKFYQAAVIGNIKDMRLLTDEVKVQSPSLAQALQQRLDDFDVKSILDCFKPTN